MIPNKLKKGDTIGLIAPSSPVEKDDLEVINNSILLMESAGFKVKFSKSKDHSHLSIFFNTWILVSNKCSVGW